MSRHSPPSITAPGRGPAASTGAGLIAFLVSDRAAAIVGTGQVIDGGTLPQA